MFDLLNRVWQDAGRRVEYVQNVTDIDDDILRRAGEAAEGLMFPLPPFDRTSEKEPVVGFVNRYMDTYQQAPDTFAAHGYDAMRIAIEVMRLVKVPEVGEIKKALQFGVSEFMGVTGPILFDDHGANSQGQYCRRALLGSTWCQPVRP